MQIFWWLMHRKEDTNSPIVIALWFCQAACGSLDNPYYVLLPCWHSCSCQTERDSKGNLHVLKKGFKKNPRSMHKHTSYNLLFIIHNLKSCWGLGLWLVGMLVFNVPHQPEAQIEMLVSVLNHHFYYPNLKKCPIQ